MRATVSCLLPAALIIIASSANAQSGAFVVRLGRDTLAVEKFTRTGNRIEGEMANHVGHVLVRHYAFDFDRTMTPTRGEVTGLNAANLSGPPAMRMVATFQGDSVFSEITRDTAVTRRRIGLTHGATIVPAGPYALWEALAVRARRASADSATYLGYGIGSPQATPLSAWRIGTDSLAFSTPWDVYHAKVDQNGRILGWIPLGGGTQQWTIERVSDLDVRAIAARWAQSEQPTQNALTMSPRDTVRSTVGGAQLMIDYGRPSKRGRDVFGTVVPFGSVWRTGANAATQFRTDRALEIGGVVVPAGFYTLWSVPSQNGWKLVINSETGQWGTDHKADRDLYQLDMQVSRLQQPVEVFTIGIVPSGSSGGILRLDWDRTRAEIPFTVR